MNQITNKHFIDFVRSEDKKIQKKNKTEDQSNIIQTFEESLLKLQNSLEKRINNKNSINSHYKTIHFFFNLYLISTKYKFVDLSIGLISCINSKSFGSALTISRSILENVTMLGLKVHNFSELLKKKNFLKLSRELFMMNVPDYAKKLFDDYKRTHVNDALRYYDDYINSKEKTIFNIYGSISERVHPSPDSFMMYQELNELKNNVKQVSFSQNSEYIQNTIYNVLVFMIVHINSVINEFYPDIEKNFVDLLKTNSDSIKVHFNNNSSDNDQFRKTFGTYFDNSISIKEIFKNFYN